jgi:hypothetical protein
VERTLLSAAFDLDPESPGGITAQYDNVEERRFSSLPSFCETTREAEGKSRDTAFPFVTLEPQEAAAAERRKNAAHSASCGTREANQPSPSGAKENPNRCHTRALSS